MEHRGRMEDHRKDYKPWLTVQDVASEGICSRIQGWKTGQRDVHLLSKPELYHFYICLWDDRVVDFREQFPLDQDRTLAFAAEMKVAHPAAGPDRLPIVMTTDARLTVKGEDGKETELCRSIKVAGSWRFTCTDILALDQLVLKLRSQIPSHDLSPWLFEQMSDEARQRIISFRREPDPRLMQTLVMEFNRIITSGHIYTPERFAKVFITPRSWEAIEASQQPDSKRGTAKQKKGGFVRANALLLRDAFPSEISKREPIDGLTPRDKQKMEIERRYWTEYQKIPWELVTLADMDIILARNVEALHPFYNLAPYGVSLEQKEQIKGYLYCLLQQHGAGLSELAARIDQQLALSPGHSLTVAKHLIITKEWKVDLTLPFEPWSPVTLLN